MSEEYDPEWMCQVCYIWMPRSVVEKHEEQCFIDESSALECTHWEKKGKKIRECMYLATTRRDLWNHIESGKHVFHH